jgi:hypothetical protein
MGLVCGSLQSGSRSHIAIWVTGQLAGRNRRPSVGLDGAVRPPSLARSGTAIGLGFAAKPDTGQGLVIGRVPLLVGTRDIVGLG